ncbi:hypothetical protein BSKO_02510 [Bryopsis sp. KO-2023]|nr:hypothetical protein BSKO_02510 [Bryopsis sp. KO-2023]
MSKLFASALLLLVLSTVGVTSRPVGFGTHFALATEELVEPLLNTENLWCLPGHGWKEFLHLQIECLNAGSRATFTGNPYIDFTVCCPST